MEEPPTPPEGALYPRLTLEIENNSLVSSYSSLPPFELGAYDEIELSDTTHCHPSQGLLNESLENTSLKTCANAERGEYGSGEPNRRSGSIHACVDPFTSLNEDREATTPKPGWWADQMFVDRTLRSMAMLMSVLAITTIVVCVALASKFKATNFATTSVPIAYGSKKSLDSLCEGIKFLINIAATLVLSASNTYQQLVTALGVEDLEHALVKYGDSRVATNSPFSIRHKRGGRKSVLFAWLLLIFTSMPVHLLANSVIGVSKGYNQDVKATLLPVQLKNYDQKSFSFYDSESTYCWSAFRRGSHRHGYDDWLHTPDEWDGTYFDPIYYPEDCQTIKDNRTEYPNPWEEEDNYQASHSCVTNIKVFYDDENCGPYVNQSISAAAVREEWDSQSYQTGIHPNCTAEQVAKLNATSSYRCPIRYTFLGECSNWNVRCEYDKPPSDPCHRYILVVRISAATTLAVCLCIKAVYMVTVNIRSRYRVKSKCLTFGDILVASVLVKARISSESLVNSGDFHRKKTIHKCHRHCKIWAASSETGDDLGHCQNCTSFNSVNNMPDLPWPTLSTKSKKSLITNLGQTALTQMLTLSFSSTAMLVGSIVLASLIIPYYSPAVCANWTTYTEQFTKAQILAKMKGKNLWTELAAFCISNGAQLIYSALYLLLLYNITLISIEYDWSQFERKRCRIRCTIVKGPDFDQSYLLQLPKRIMLPIMIYSVVMHWLLGLAIYTEEIVTYNGPALYQIVTVPACVWGSTMLLLVMTVTCWWTFTYKREGYIPEMYGSIRILCAATSELHDFPPEGIHWGDLTKEDSESPWRHAGLSAGPVGQIIPNELYA